VGTNVKGNGLLEIHHELMGLIHLEADLRGQLHKVGEKRGALEQQLRSWPGQPKKAGRAKASTPRLPAQAAKAAARAERKVAARAKRSNGKAGGAPAAVLSLLQAHSGTPLTIKAIKEQLLKVPPASIYNALSVLKKRGQARSAGAGKWATA
jgi:hypothetical protein